MAEILSGSLSEQGEKNLKINKSALFIVITLAFAYLFYIVFQLDLNKFILTLKHLNYYWLSLSLLSILIYWSSEAKILQIITFSLTGSFSLYNAFKVTMIGQFFNIITPFASGGQPAQLYTLNKQKINSGSAASILMIKFIVYQLVLTLYSLLLIIFKSSFFESRTSNFFYLIFIGFAVNLSVILGLYIFAGHRKIKEAILIGGLKFLRKIKLISDFQQWKDKIEAQIELFHQDLELLKNRKKMLLKIMVITIIQLSFFFLIPYFVYRSFNLSEVNQLTIIAAEAFVIMITSFIPVPGASGGAELSFYYFFGLFFLKEQLLIAIFIWRFISYYLALILGGIIIWINRKLLYK